DRRAIHVSLFNAALNRVDEKMTVVDNDDSLQEALHGQLVSFAMMNPPFLAMPEAIDIDADEGSALDLRAIFPEAGWGGEDGLQVTKQFLDTLRPLLAPESRLVIYSQFAGDDAGPTILRDYIQKIGGFVFAFEGHAQALLTVDEAATRVARLIVAAFLQKQEPRRPRLAVRKGAPEHALLSACAQQIAQS